MRLEIQTCLAHFIASISTDPNRLQRELLELVVRHQFEESCDGKAGLMLFLKNIEFKYKLSDWELA